MPLVAAILGLILAIWVLTLVVWLIQWLIAVVVWLFQAVILPIFVFLLPAALTLVILVGIYWGSWVAARNYLRSVKMNVNPEGALKTFVRNAVVSLQTLTLSLLCAGSTFLSGIAIYEASLAGIDFVHGYYATIIFPYSEILYPFWKHF